MSIVHDATLQRQLRRLKLGEESPPNQEEWQKLLKYLDSHYKHVDEDRNMMARSLEVSTEEMAKIREAVATERDHLRQTIETFQTALDDFAEACRATRNSGGEDTTAITGARKRFNLAIIKLLSIVNENSPENREVLNALRTSFINVFEEVISSISPEGALTDEIVRLHARLIPPRADVEFGELKIGGICEQLNGLGGDVWGAHQLASGQYLLYLGDATGHGATAGFLSSAVASTLQGWTQANLSVDLDQLHAYMNRVVQDLGGGTMFMTWCALIIEKDLESAAVINAGQTFPMVIRGKESKSIVLQGNPLGHGIDQRTKLGRIRLEKGDRIILYTDGITEAQSPAGEEFGERRLRKLVEESGAPDSLSLAEDVFSQMHDFRSGRTMTDDATIVVATIN